MESLDSVEPSMLLHISGASFCGFSILLQSESIHAFWFPFDNGTSIREDTAIHSKYWVYANFQVYFFTGHLLISIGVAYAASMAFEAPIMGIEKLLLPRRKAQKQLDELKDEADGQYVSYSEDADIMEHDQLKEDWMKEISVLSDLKLCLFKPVLKKNNLTQLRTTKRETHCSLRTTFISL